MQKTREEVKKIYQSVALMDYEKTKTIETCFGFNAAIPSRLVLCPNERFLITLLQRPTLSRIIKKQPIQMKVRQEDVIPLKVLIGGFEDIPKARTR
ncbi:jg24290 [Pararge aegeria aegeria]|uniref:Jg24290 protein n=1 Tax=Pararge aegeria aegeria TaxID=348720 RepID=A0A8S4SEM5_9NEOP|nr:jg24290 [Pararge aegeria aegeria]